MNISLRKLLLVNLLLALIGATTLSFIANYIVDKKDLEQHLDLFLGQTGLSLQALLNTNLDKVKLHQIQQKLDQLPQYAKNYVKSSPPAFAYQNRFYIQIWHKNLLLHSINGPDQLLNQGLLGFSYVTYQRTPWRVFTTQPNSQGIKVTVAEKYNIRTQLIHRIAQDDILILLLVFPILSILIWLILGKGLSSLHRIANEVANRDRDCLTPIDIATVPQEIKGLVQELNQLLGRLQAALAREKRFAGNAAHELKTPLTALKTQAQVALQTSDKERIKALQNLIQCVDRSAHIIQQLLIMNRLTAEHQLAEGMQPLVLHPLVVKELTLITPTALEKAIELHLIADNPQCMIIGNEIALGILVRNLVDNAIRYTPHGGQVTITLEEKSTTVNLTVIDTGPGIPQELHQQVFERFFRIVGNNQSGSGLGLAIVNQIVHLHQADINLMTPDDGKGLAVQVVFSSTKKPI